MTEKIPEASDIEMIQLFAAQEVLRDNPQLQEEYFQKIKEKCERYGVEVPNQVEREL
jgi:RNase P subunit RPR2